MLAACQPNSPMENSMNTEVCYKVVQSYMDKIDTDLRRANANDFLKYRDQCEGSGIYEVSLASIYFVHGDNQNAIAMAKQGLALEDSDKDALTHVLVSAAIAAKNFEEARKAAQTLLEADNNSRMGNLLLAKYFNVTGQFSESILRAENAVAMGGNDEAYAILITAYYNSNQFEEAVKSYEAGLQAHQNMQSNIDAVLAASASYYEVGNKQASLDVLNRHVELVPESKEHPLVIKMHEILSEP